MQKSDFPKIDHYRPMQVQSIFFETVNNSGEKILVSIVVTSDECIAYEVINRFDKLKCLFKENFDFIKQVILSLIEDLDSSRANDGTLKSRPSMSLSCFKLGAEKRIFGSDEKQVSKSLLEENSNLYDIGYRAPEKTSKKVSIGWRNLNNVVYSFVTQNRLDFSKRFSRSSASKTNEGFLSTNADQSVDYFGVGLVSSFCFFGNEKFSRNYKQSAEKIVDLQYARALSKQECDYELMLFLPSSVGSERLSDSLSEKLRRLEERTKEFDLIMEKYGSPEAIGKRILMDSDS